jgi:putative hydrolase of the HAD superfamily
MKKLLVFDLGGVIINFNIGVMGQWTGLSSDAFWRRWLKSEAVRDFESGKTGRHTFARELTAEFDLPVSPQEFLTIYRTWHKGLYPEARPLLEALAPQYTLACLSNINEIIWADMLCEQGIDRLFRYRFASHEMGCLKPDPEAYAYLLREVPFEKEEILFLDDNPVNVEAAQAFGIDAYVTRGPEEARATLLSLGLLRGE